MKIKLVKPPVPVQYEPINLTVETSDEFEIIRAALFDYGRGELYFNTSPELRQTALKLAERMREYARGKTIPPLARMENRQNSSG
jgi:hypothetical protein